MRDDLQNKLFDEFPDILERCDDVTKSCMFWGLDVGDGWYDILHGLCTELRAACSKNSGMTCKAEQVKEKFGGLRFYVRITEPNEEETPSFKIIHQIIEKYEIKSSQTCETCGKPGERRKGGWIVTLCKDCYDKRSKG